MILYFNLTEAREGSVSVYNALGLFFYTFYATYTTYTLIFCASIQFKKIFEKPIDTHEEV